jgi:uncharacterized protein (TIGR00251 family)
VSPCLKESSGSVLLSLKIVPRASRNEIVGISGNELRLRVTAPPVDSAANGAVLDFLAEHLGIPRRNLQLVRCATNPHKVVSISGMALAEISRRLGLPA